MTALAYVAIAGCAGCALFVWLWRRERKARRRAEAAAETHQVRLEAETKRAADIAASRARLEADLEVLDKKYAAELQRLRGIRARLDKAVANEDDQALADEWNALMGNDQ